VRGEEALFVKGGLSHRLDADEQDSFHGSSIHETRSSFYAVITHKSPFGKSIMRER
jgi:hypothetical protein